MNRFAALVSLALMLSVISACANKVSNTVIGGGPLSFATANDDLAEKQHYCPGVISVTDESVKAPPLNEMGNQVVRSAALEVLDGLGPDIIDTRRGSDLDVVVRRAYVHSLATSKSAVVVVSVTNNETGESTVYRGRSVGVIWWGTQKEYLEGLKLAMQEALGPMTYQLQRICIPQTMG